MKKILRFTSLAAILAVGCLSFSNSSHALISLSIQDQTLRTELQAFGILSLGVGAVDSFIGFNPDAAPGDQSGKTGTGNLISILGLVVLDTPSANIQLTALSPSDATRLGLNVDSYNAQIGKVNLVWNSIYASMVQYQADGHSSAQTAEYAQKVLGPEVAEPALGADTFAVLLKVSRSVAEQTQ